jgi:tetratricopeptide (TPR) repeat protein
LALSLFAPDDRSIDYWRITNDLAVTLRYQDRPKEALPLFLDALDGLAGADGTRAVKLNIAKTLRELDRLEEACIVFEETLADQDALLTPDPGFVAEILTPLIKVYRALGQDEKADRASQRLAEIDRPRVT